MSQTKHCSTTELLHVLALLYAQVFSDRDIVTRKAELESALSTADVFFGSLLFDYDQVRAFLHKQVGCM